MCMVSTIVVRRDGVNVDMVASTGDDQVRRRAYRHGDLHRALVEAGLQLARGGGPDAVVLREATRRVGVSPNAAYRHFTDHHALLEAVCAGAQAALADAIETELTAAQTGVSDRAAGARAGLRAVGTAYVAFAQTEPGLFRTAFSVPVDLATAGSPAKAGSRGRTPFQLLAAALDTLVEAGVLPPQRRRGAEALAWSAVHGLAVLAIDGPLRDFDRAQIDSLTQRLVDMVEYGLYAPG